MSEISPGPWRWYKRFLMSSEETRKDIVLALDCEHDLGSAGVEPADARAIAAVPDLVAFLERVVSGMWEREEIRDEARTLARRIYNG